MNKLNKMTNSVDKFDNNLFAGMTFPTTANEVKRGNVICINNRPCKIIEYNLRKIGRHGNPNAYIAGVDIFTKRRIEKMYVLNTILQIPSMVRREYSIISINDNDICCLLDVETKEMNNEIKLPDETEHDIEIAKKIKNFITEGKPINVFVLYALNIEKITDIKEV